MGTEIHDVDNQTARVLADVAAERRRQLREEGFSREADRVHYPHGELALAAACYIHPQPMLKLDACRDTGEATSVPTDWPWHLKWWKPHSRRVALVKGIALAIAEIERLDAEASDKSAAIEAVTDALTDGTVLKQLTNVKESSRGTS